MSDLPSPPVEIADLIEQGKVTLFTGRKPWSEDESEFRRDTTLRRSQMAAETRFELNYDYSSRMSWRTQGDGSSRKVLVSVTFTKVSLSRKHQIWLRRNPQTEKFWSDRVVQHEFDHVRLSTLPDYSVLFAKNLRKTRYIARSIDTEVRVNERYVRRLVDEHVRQEFDEIVDLVTIRYRELDRETQHGLDPLPTESGLNEWLKPTQP